MRHDLRPIMDLKPCEQSASARKDIMKKLLGSIRDIELQLGAKTRRRHVDGTDMTLEEIALWRVKALKALNHNTALYREYKDLEREDYERKFGETIASFITKIGALLASIGKGLEVSDSVQAATEDGCEGGIGTSTEVFDMRP